jgi:hypothetical protein
MHNDDSILAAMKGSFAGIEQQMDRYPKLKIDAITDQVGATNQIEKTRVGASCSRGFTIKLNVNPFAVANPKRVHDNTANNDQTHWHPYGTEANVYQFNTIHEFGHAVDWRAFVWEQDKKDGYLDIDKNNQKRHAAIMKVLYKEYSDANDGNKPSGENELLVWIKAKKQVSAYSWERNDKGELTGQLQDDELLAEAWGACEFGAGRPTKVELALHNLMWEGLKKHGLT